MDHQLSMQRECGAVRSTSQGHHVAQFEPYVGMLVGFHGLVQIPVPPAVAGNERFHGGLNPATDGPEIRTTVHFPPHGCCLADKVTYSGMTIEAQDSGN